METAGIGEAPDVERAHWKRSTFCGDSACVEVAAGPGGVAVRDSKRPDSAPLTFTTPEWQAFVLGVKNGEFDV
ncbi:MAG: DUF397 domain-containing protein [Actinobacteria bacterium]|nr:DUF397 domain-containing protein [Actinomycetota bacterium]